MKRETTGQGARQAMRGHWVQAWAWEGAVLCGTLALMTVQGIAAAVCEIPAALPTPAFVWAHPALLWITAGGLLGDLLLLSPIRFGRAAFYAKRAAVKLPFSMPESPSPPPGSLLHSRHGKAAIRRLVSAVRRLWRAGRYRRIVAGRLLWWGWNLLGALLFLSMPTVALVLSAGLPSAAAPYPFYLAALGWLSAAIGAVLWVTWSLRMSPLQILLAANPRFTVCGAARAALNATRGRTFWLIRRTLGFFGWFFTCAAVIPIAYVQPMYATAQATWLLALAQDRAKEKTSCKANSLYMRNNCFRKRRLI